MALIDMPHYGYYETFAPLLASMHDMPLCNFSAPWQRRRLQYVIFGIEPNKLTLANLGKDAAVALGNAGVLVSSISALQALRFRDGTASLLSASLGDAAWGLTPRTVPIVAEQSNLTAAFVSFLNATWPDTSRPYAYSGSRWIVKRNEGFMAQGVTVWTSMASGRGGYFAWQSAAQLQHALHFEAGWGFVSTGVLQPLIPDPLLYNGRKLNQRNEVLLLPGRQTSRMFYELGQWMVGKVHTEGPDAEIVHTRGKVSNVGDRENFLVAHGTPSAQAKSVAKLAAHIAAHPDVLQSDGWRRWQLLPVGTGAGPEEVAALSSALTAAIRAEYARFMGVLLTGLHPHVSASPHGQFSMLGADCMLDSHGKLWLIEVNLMPVTPTGGSASRVAYFTAIEREILQIVMAWHRRQPLPTQLQVMIEATSGRRA